MLTVRPVLFEFAAPVRLFSDIKGSLEDHLEEEIEAFRTAERTSFQLVKNILEIMLEVRIPRVLACTLSTLLKVPNNALGLLANVFHADAARPRSIMT